MIKPIDDTMNRVACFEAPIVDALSEVLFVVSGLTSVYGLYRAATSNVVEGGTFLGSGIIGMLSASYTKEISQSVEKSCKV